MVTPQFNVLTEEWECENPACPEGAGIHETYAEARECASEAMCVCGCPRKWHQVTGMVTGCYSPGCFDCREFEAA